jgi:hypothetical protein
MNIEVNFYGLITVFILLLFALIMIVILLRKNKNFKLSRSGIEIIDNVKSGNSKHTLVIQYIRSLQEELDYIKMKGTKKKQLEKAESIIQEFTDDLNTMFLDYFESELSADTNNINVNSRKLKMMTLISDIIRDKMKDRIRLSVDINHFNNRTGAEWDCYIDSKVKLNIDITLNTLKSNYDAAILGVTLDPFLKKFEKDIKTKIDLKIRQLYEEMKKISGDDIKSIANIEKQIKDLTEKSACT